MKNLIKKLWHDESAQGMIEYILLLVVVISIVFLFRNNIKSVIESKTQKLGDDISSFE